MPPKILVGYGVDLDSVSNWLNTRDGSPVDQANVSRGIFGATVGVDRLLALFERHQIKTSWFVPAHTLESFPPQVAKVRDAGHEIALHGYTHEAVSALTLTQERAVLQKSHQTLTKFLGHPPKGWTCPSWTPSRSSVHLLEDFGLTYDHSFMHHDSQMYFLPYPPATAKETNYSLSPTAWMSPMSRLRPSSIIEIPANWHLDDWPPFQPRPALGSAGFVDPHQIERSWREQFEFCLSEYADSGFVFPITIHPQVSGKPQILMMHERFIEYLNSHDGVEWCTFEQMAEQYKNGLMKGVVVEGGVDFDLYV